MRTSLSMWISAEESLPENGSTVLGFRDADPHWGNAAYGMAWREIDDESKPGLRWNESGRPTHWMRLPAPPRGINDGLLIGGGMRQTYAEYRAEIGELLEKAEAMVWLRLTDAELEAVEFFAVIDTNDGLLGGHTATLRELLERHKASKYPQNTQDQERRL